MHLNFAIPCLLILVRWLWPLALPLWKKGVLAVLLLVGSQYHLWSKLSSGSVFAPEFPRPLIILFNWAFGAILLLAVLQILLDLVTLVIAVVRGALRLRRHNGPMRFGTFVAAFARRAHGSFHDRSRYAIAIVASLLAAVGVAGALGVPPVRDVEVAVRGLPPQFEGYRLLQLTDLHISRLFPASWARQVVDRANASGADLIVVTGDFIDGTVAMRSNDVEPLRDLRAPDGIYAVPGNHEYIFHYPTWVPHLESLGMRMLPNAHAILTREDARLVIAGVTDLSARRYGQAPPDLTAALAGAPTTAPVILLDHQPRNARQAAACGVALQLSGHTHGGMIVGLDRMVARANGGFVSGRYQVGNMTLYVSNGTALWPGFALRLGRPPEITRITLRAPLSESRQQMNGFVTGAL